MFIRRNVNSRHNKQAPKLCNKTGKCLTKTWNRVRCAERVVASVWSVWTFLSSSDIYRAFLSLERAADCRFAMILHKLCTFLAETWMKTQISPYNMRLSNLWEKIYIPTKGWGVLSREMRIALAQPHDLTQPIIASFKVWKEQLICPKIKLK